MPPLAFITARLPRPWPRLALHLAGLGCLLLALVLAARRTGVYADDAFITLSYARNLAEERGMRFNLDERVLGTTTPLWCWLNAAAFVVTGATPATTAGLYWLATLGAALAFVRLGLRLGLGTASWAGAIYFALMPHHIWLCGMETSLAIWLALEALLAITPAFMQEGGLHWGRAGLLAALLALTRPEAALLFPLLAAMACWRGWRGLPWEPPPVLRRLQFRPLGRLLAGAAAIGLPAALLLGLYFGSPLPNTLAAKQAQLASGRFPWVGGIGQGLGHYLRQTLFGRLWYVDLLPWGGLLGVAIFAHLRLKDRLIHPNLAPMLLMGAWAALHGFMLAGLGVAFYEWYLYPVWLVLVLVICFGAWFVTYYCGIDSRRLGFSENAQRRLCLLLIVATFPLAAFAQRAAWRGDPAALQRARAEGYRKLAEVVNRKHTPGTPEALQSFEIGVLRFYLAPQIRLIDEASLVHRLRQPGYLPTREDLVREHQPRWLVESWPGAHAGDPAVLERQNPASLAYYGTDAAGRPLHYATHTIEASAYGVQFLSERSGH